MHVIVILKDRFPFLRLPWFKNNDYLRQVLGKNTFQQRKVSGAEEILGVIRSYFHFSLEDCGRVHIGNTRFCKGIGGKKKRKHQKQSLGAMLGEQFSPKYV